MMNKITPIHAGEILLGSIMLLDIVKNYTL